jgi:chromosome segregation ATPase
MEVSPEIEGFVTELRSQIAILSERCCNMQAEIFKTRFSQNVMAQETEARNKREEELNLVIQQTQNELQATKNELEELKAKSQPDDPAEPMKRRA